jgi:periplasmic divalent cation tolerance protein
MTEVCAVVITAPDTDWLAAFTRQLVRDRLCASGHIVTPIRSIYTWHDEIHDRPEAHVTLHTRTKLVAKITSRTTEQHPYEVPCVVATPITMASPAYTAWIVQETKAAD